MIEQVTRTLYRIACSRSNAYLAAGSGLVLIDTGMPADSDRIISAIKHIGYNPADLQAIVLTHGHLDHAGSAARLQQISGAQVAAGAADAEYIEGRRMLCSMPREGAGGKVFRLVLFVLEKYIQRYAPVQVDIKHAPGGHTDISGLSLIGTPGHSPGSISVYDSQQKVLIVGDALSGEPEVHLPPRPGCACYAEALRSVQKLARCDFDICLFGHGPPLRPDAAGRIQRLAGALP